MQKRGVVASGCAASIPAMLSALHPCILHIMRPAMPWQPQLLMLMPLQHTVGAVCGAGQPLYAWSGCCATMYAAQPWRGLSLPACGLLPPTVGPAGACALPRLPLQVQWAARIVAGGGWTIAADGGLYHEEVVPV